MKTVFIVNPLAGQGKKVDFLIDKINNLKDDDTEMYITKFPGDATSYVRAYCEDNGPARFIVCGGDGTLNEVLNGVIDFDDAEVGIIPVGTGNDFKRNFENGDMFNEVKCQIFGSVERCDAIKYKTVINDEIKTGYCANMFNIGFDCNVADLKNEMQKKPFISGSMSYLISIFVTLIKKKGENLKIEIDGNETHNGKLLLTSIANGCYCGGGIMSNPLASVKDGLININIIKNVSRLKFLRLLPYYMKGNFLNLKNIHKVILSEKCSRVKITPLDGKMRICVDGEIIDAGETEFEICHNAFNFVLPQKYAPNKNYELMM
jgi:YegS/Rv2252/BmrU family lipid kinase